MGFRDAQLCQLFNFALKKIRDSGVAALCIGGGEGTAMAIELI